MHAPVVDVLGGAAMGTTWTVRAVAPGADLRALHAAIAAVLDEVIAQMSNWEHDSHLSRYNTAPPGSLHAIPDGFRRVLQAAVEIAEASGGAFDPTIGPAVAAWGFGPPAHRTDANSLADARVDWTRIRCDVGALLQPGGVQLDLCGIAKGHAVDAVAARLRELGVAAAVVEVGGELYAYGRKPDATPWRVLVEAWSGDERDERPARIVSLDGRAIATSGDRWHRREHEGRRISHTLDPRTLEPVRDPPAAVTVVADDAMRADAWATALTVLGTDAGHALACSRGIAARFVGSAAQGHEERMTPAFAALLDE
jgi:thiamine biosynthesis lipoprotein